MSDNDNDYKNSDIIEFLIECLVISKLANIQRTNKLMSRRMQTSFSINKKMIDIKLNNLFNIKKMEKEYKNYDLVYNA